VQYDVVYTRKGHSTRGSSSSFTKADVIPPDELKDDASTEDHVMGAKLAQGFRL
jgi:hypothetical protein